MRHVAVAVLVCGVLQAGPRRYEFSRPEMGTLFRIVLYADSRQEAAHAARLAFARVRELDGVLSHYRTDSELSRLGESGAWHVVSRDLFRVLERSLYFARLTAGAFDPTLGAVTRLWRQAERKPDEPVLEAARLRTGYEKVSIDAGRRAVRFSPAGVELDLGGIAKGYAADEALKRLHRRGIRAALVDAGGDIVLFGTPPGRPGWRIGLQGGGTLTLTGGAVATSGSSARYVETPRGRFSHIVDPKTGLGLRSDTQVSVIAPDATTADALATAFSVMPVGEGLELARSRDGVCALWIIRSGAESSQRSCICFPDLKRENGRKGEEP